MRDVRFGHRSSVYLPRTVYGTGCFWLTAVAFSGSRLRWRTIWKCTDGPPNAVNPRCQFAARTGHTVSAALLSCNRVLRASQTPRARAEDMMSDEGGLRRARRFYMIQSNGSMRMRLRSCAEVRFYSDTFGPWMHDLACTWVLPAKME